MLVVNAKNCEHIVPIRLVLFRARACRQPSSGTSCHSAPCMILSEPQQSLWGQPGGALSSKLPGLGAFISSTTVLGYTQGAESTRRARSAGRR
jgi:hypothetical protein